MNEQLHKFEQMANATRVAKGSAAALLKSGRYLQKRCQQCGQLLVWDFDALVRKFILDPNLNEEPPTEACHECSMRQRLEQHGVPLKLTPCSFSTFRIENQTDKSAHESALKFCEHFHAHPILARKHTLVLSSKVNGTGKSHLSVAILRRWFQLQVRSGWFTNQLQIGAMLADTYRSDYTQEPKAKFGRAAFVVLDDLGQDSGRRDELAAVEAILTERDARCGWTVITTNLEQGAFAKWIGPRVTDRLMESIFAWVTMGNVSRRTA